MLYYYWDPTYVLVLIGAIVCLIASANVKSTYAKYGKVRSYSGMTGAEVAQRILNAAGIYDVKVGHVRGDLTDHYNPATKVLNLSDTVYDSTSVAALSVAAHECGHAIQHMQSYAPLKFRTAFVPVANIGSKLAWPIIIVGLLINSESSQMIINAGIIMFSLAVLFQLVTLPVEFDASKRAMHMLEHQRVLRETEIPQAKKVLSAAALTYVASAAAAILQLLRLVVLFGGRRRND